MKRNALKNYGFALTAFSLLLSSCKIVGPDHSTPNSEMAASYKSSASTYSKRMGNRWWGLFGDPKLNSLMSELQAGNFDLRAAEARRNQAYASLGVNRSQLYPQVTSNAEISRNRTSENGINQGFGPTYYDDYGVAMSLGYEVDLWGRVRRIVQAGQSSAAAAEVSVDQVRLSLQAQLARSYFALRFIDSEVSVLRQALETRRETLDLATNRFKSGATSEVDVARAKSELASAKAQLVALESPRASLENAIAILAGKNASNFSISPETISKSAPNVSSGSPTQLLGRRPDVFIAEMDLAAASAGIGIAKADFYPKVTLIGTGGFSSIKSSDFLKWSSREFSIGPNVDLPIFQGKRRLADFENAKAKQQEALASYQQTVLEAFADVENALAARRGAIRETSAQKESISAAKRSYELSEVRYKEGVSTYLEVADSQRELLNAERSEVQARGRSFEATVQLIQALGGGFSK